MTTTPEVGTRVCALGHGTSATAHYHGTITRETKTLLIVTSGKREVETRFRKDTMVSTPRTDWGYVSLSTKCQKPQ